MTKVRVELPAHLRTLAGTGSEVLLELSGEPTVEQVINTLEERYPMLKGTIREHGTRRRRAYMRYYACGEDISHQPPGARLPEAIVNGKDSLIILGAISGG